MTEVPLPILVLQHPQEPSRKDQEISSAQIICENVTPSHIVVGLSWRNIKHALKDFVGIQKDDGEILSGFENPAHWATLYLGTKKHSGNERLEPGLYFLDKKGELRDPAEDQKPIHGLIILDGTWAQAKTMWWRNAWLLRTQRMFLVPKEKSLYGNLRKEPRPECVSTVEAVAETLSFCGIDSTVEQKLKSAFSSALLSFKK